MCCSWDGQTYIVNHNRAVVRYQFQESVAAFTAGTNSCHKSTKTPDDWQMDCVKNCIEDLINFWNRWWWNVAWIEDILVNWCQNYTPIFKYMYCECMGFFVYQSWSWGKDFDKGQKFWSSFHLGKENILKVE